MKPTLKLYENIRDHQKKNRYTDDGIGEALGYKKRVWAMKMNRLKNGNETIITVSDMGRLMKLFGCTYQALMNDVVFDVRVKND